MITLVCAVALAAPPSAEMLATTTTSATHTSVGGELGLVVPTSSPRIALHQQLGLERWAKTWELVESGQPANTRWMAEPRASVRLGLSASEAPTQVAIDSGVGVGLALSEDGLLWSPTLATRPSITVGTGPTPLRMGLDLRVSLLGEPLVPESTSPTMNIGLSVGTTFGPHPQP